MHRHYNKNYHKRSRRVRRSGPQSPDAFAMRQNVPMPEIGSILGPCVEGEPIAFWHKTEKPRGLFVRVLYQDGIHTCVCNPGHTQGIVVFLERAPYPWDHIKIIDSGQNTCRGIPINKYDDILKKIEEIYLESDDKQLNDIVYDVLNDEETCGLNFSEMSESEQFKVESHLFMGCSRIAKEKEDQI